MNKNSVLSIKKNNGLLISKININITRSIHFRTAYLNNVSYLILPSIYFNMLYFLVCYNTPVIFINHLTYYDMYIKSL